MATKTEQSTLVIKEIILETVTLRIVGETPLIMHAWSEKANGKAKIPRRRNPAERKIIWQSLKLGIELLW